MGILRADSGKEINNLPRIVFFKKSYECLYGVNNCVLKSRMNV